MRWADFLVENSISRAHASAGREKGLHVSTIFLYICAVQSRSNSTADALFEIADAQQGYFTAKQAADAGYLLGG